MSSDQKLSEKDRNQLMKERRYFKCYEYEYLITNRMTKIQNVSNVAEKNNTESVFTRKKISKKCRFSTTDDESEN